MLIRLICLRLAARLGAPTIGAVRFAAEIEAYLRTGKVS